MRLFRTKHVARHAAEAGFTMVEIAISLAIVAFALVAILGVLPTGMSVQKDNREDTQMKVDGLYFLDAIRNGARGLQDLTNYVEEVRVVQSLKGKMVSDLSYTNLDAEQIIGILGTPKYPGGIGMPELVNRVTARVRGISGSAAEKTTRDYDIAFRFELESEVVPVVPLNFDDFSAGWQTYSSGIEANLHDLRLTVRWPVFEKGLNNWTVGRNHKVLSTMVAGQVTRTNYPMVNLPAYFFQLNQYANAPRL